jgi:two-component system response regulator VicR
MNVSDKHILIIDDDADLSFIISEMLESYGYQTSHATSAEEGIELLSKQPFHLILLDINLPEMSGFELCKELRLTHNIPVIFASARTEVNDRIMGLDIGGDDYLPKPYSMKELLSHVNALMRRCYGFMGEEERVCFGSIVVDIGARTVTKDGTPVSLSLKEFDLLSCLCKNKNKVLSKETLIAQVWGAYSMVEPSTLTVHIRWLREKLEETPASPKYIKTAWGFGYTLEVRDED